MNLPLAVAAVCLALLGTAEARLGETLKEIEDRYGKLISTSSLSDKALQETHNEENMEKKVIELAGIMASENEELETFFIKKTGEFNGIIFQFFKDKTKHSGKCIAVTYIKIYMPFQLKDLELDDGMVIPVTGYQLDISPEKVEEIVYKEVPNIKKIEPVSSSGVKGGVGNVPWTMEWKGTNGESLNAEMSHARDFDSGQNFAFFRLFCLSKELIEFLQSKENAQEQERQKNTHGFLGIEP